MIRRSAFLSVLLLLLLFPPSSEAMGRRNPPATLLMGVMGDSISAGTLSDIPLNASGDIETKLIVENKETLSWASGQSIISHFELLKRWLKSSDDPRKLDVVNVSQPGDRTRNMPEQARILLARFKTGHYSELVYLTILIGSNDACGKGQGTAIGRMRSELLETFSILSSLKPKQRLRILLVGIPRIPDLGSPAIRRARTSLFGLRCSTVRDRLFRHCPNLLRWKTEEQYHEAMAVVESKNRLLRSVAAEANAAFPELEIIYSDHLFKLEIPASMLAIDCFHPGKRGQQAIASDVWLDQPWFRP